MALVTPLISLIYGNFIEYVEGDTAPGHGQHSWEHEQESITYIVPFAEEASYICTILGYAQTIGSQLSRKNPLQHPRFPWLRATTITDITRKVYAKPPKASLIPLSAANAHQQTETSNLKKSFITVEFTPLPYELHEDIEGVPEYQRNTYFKGDGTGSFITAKGYNFKYADGTPLGTPLADSMAILEGKDTLNLIWEGVPVTYCCGLSYPMMPHIQDAVGCVNNTTFFNQAAYTLLLDSYTYETKQFPIYGTSGRPVLYRDITLKFKFFNPVQNLGGTFGGHLVYPWPTDRKYYLVSADGTQTASKYRYQQTYFPDIFIQADLTPDF